MNIKKCSIIGVTALFFLLPFMAVANGNKESKGTAKGNVSEKSLVVSETATTITCYDADGSIVTIKKNPSRVVVNFASLVSLWYLAGGTAIGIPDSKPSDNVPEVARKAASTGHYTSPNIEKVLSLKPDLLIIPAHIEKQVNLKAIAKQNGVEVLAVTYEIYDDLEKTLDLFFRINGKRMEDSSVAMAIDRNVKTVIEKTIGKKAPTFISFLASTRTVKVETNKAHAAYMAYMLGAVNAIEKYAAGSNLSRLTLSDEKIILENPDVILISCMGDDTVIREKMEADYFSKEPWASMKAVKNKRVYYLPDEFFIYKPTERFPEAFEYMYNCLYPQAK